MMEFETPQKENKAMGIGQIKRAITSMPMALHHSLNYLINA